MQFDEAGEIIIPTDKPVIHTVSCDEKPGIQVLSTTSEELRPTDKNSCHAGCRIQTPKYVISARRH